MSHTQTNLQPFRITLLACLIGLGVPGGAALAGSHLWRINELFSSADGSIQFIELYECCGAERETNMGGLRVTCDVTGKVFSFPEDLEGNTANRYLLLATAGFADLPGAPEPDYTIPDSFFSLESEFIWYSPSRTYDSFEYDVGDLPVNGVNSVHVTDYVTDEFTIGVNSPTNYLGESGSVDLGAVLPPFVRGDCNGDGVASGDVIDPLFLLYRNFAGAASPPCEVACDVNGDGSTAGVADAVFMLMLSFSATAGLQPADPYPVCGIVASEPGGPGCDVPPVCE
jgi:hypothetical protein